MIDRSLCVRIEISNAGRCYQLLTSSRLKLSTNNSKSLLLLTLSFSHLSTTLQHPLKTAVGATAQVGDMESNSTAPAKEEVCASCPATLQAKDVSTSYVVRSFFAAAITGFLFGLVFQKSRVFEIASIRGQMVFKRWVMLKMFLGAAASGSAVCGLTSHFNPPLYSVIREKYRGSCERSFVYALIGGSLILGIGMTVSSACPGMVLA